MESGFDLKAIPVVMLGGGASVVKGNVSEQDSLCRVFALIDDKVNAEGFERILGQIFGRCGQGISRPSIYVPPQPTRMKNIAEHGKSCRLCRKARKTPFWYR